MLVLDPNLYSYSVQEENKHDDPPNETNGEVDPDEYSKDILSDIIIEKNIIFEGITVKAFLNIDKNTVIIDYPTCIINAPIYILDSCLGRCILTGGGGKSNWIFKFKDGCVMTNTSIYCTNVRLYDLIKINVLDVGKATFTFPEHFTSEEFQKWDPFITKCYLMYTFNKNFYANIDDNWMEKTGFNLLDALNGKENTQKSINFVEKVSEKISNKVEYTKVEYTKEYVDKLSIEEIDTLVKETLEKPCIKLNRDFHLADLPGIYHISLPNNNEFHGEKDNGPGLLTSLNGIAYRGIFLNKHSFKGTKIDKSGIIYTGAFKGRVLNGDNCTVTYPNGIKMFGSFENGKNKVTEGLIIPKKYIIFENIKGTLSKEKYNDAIIKLSNGIDMVPELVIRDKSIIINDIRMIFLNKCNVLMDYNYKDWEFNCHYDRDGFVLNNVSILKMNNFYFSFEEDFTLEDLLKWDPFTFKCYLLATFPKFSTEFFNNYTNKNLTTESLQKLDEKDYLEMGLVEDQYKQMKSNLEYLVQCLKKDID